MGDGYIRRDPKTGEYQKRSIWDELGCFTIIALVFVGTLAVASVVGAFVGSVTS